MNDLRELRCVLLIYKKLTSRFRMEHHHTAPEALDKSVADLQEMRGSDQLIQKPKERNLEEP